MARKARNPSTNGEAGSAANGAPADALPAAIDAGLDTPAMRQWAQAKQQVPDALLFFRMGDFYELFHQDAEEIAARLGLTLTSRTKDRSVPMAGVPYHSADQYIRRLLALGYRIAICEQLEDPALTKGLVRRGVVRVITPGTVIEESLLPGESNNYLAALCPPVDTPGFLGFQAGRVAAVDKKGAPLVDFAQDWGVAWLDLSTGTWGYEEGPREAIEDWLVSLAPAELLVPGPTWDGKALTPFQPARKPAAGNSTAAAGATATGTVPAATAADHAGKTVPAASPRLEKTAVVTAERAQFDPLLALEALSEFFARRKGFTPPHLGPGLGACGAILHYLRSTQFDVPTDANTSPLPVASFSGGLKSLSHIEPPERAGREKGMVLEGDAATHLELVESSAGVARSLLGCLRLNKTAAGTRLMRQWLLQPLKDIKAISERHGGIAWLIAHAELLQELRGGLATVGDMERLTARVCTERANARDLAALVASLKQVGVLHQRLQAQKVAGEAGPLMERLA
ncbi:MAG TPA: hypothetical protein VL860_06430, partial [Planctomycetota bacterium]|nr:hypothetical protein [Planctomycetota bacterium]